MPPAWSWYLGSLVLGCCTLRCESQSSAGLRMQPYPRAPGHVWPGHLHGTGCLSARAMDTGFPTVVWRLCLGLGFAVTPPSLAGVWGVDVCARASPAPCQSWLGYAVWVCVFGFGFWLHPAIPWIGCWGVCVCVRAPPVPLQSWLGCAVRLLGCGFWLHPANPGSGLRCVCPGSGCAVTPPILAGVLGCVCLRARSVRTPPFLARGFWGFLVRVSGYGFRLHPAVPGSGLRCGCVRWGLGFGFTPPILARVLVCVCLCARSACTPKILAGVWGVCVCVCAPFVPRQSWPGCAVRVFGCGFWLHPANLG